MEWDEGLFAFLDDLEGRAEALYDAERETDLVDRSRTEYAAVTLASRLMASLAPTSSSTCSGSVRSPVCCSGSARLVPRPRRGAGLGGPARGGRGRGRCLRAVRSPRSPGHPVARLGLGSALRRLADAGERCVVHATDGTAREAVVARVGADFVEVSMGEGRSLLLARDAIAAVQSRG